MQKKFSKFFIAALASFLVTAIVILIMPLDIMLGVLDAQWYDALLGAFLYLSVISGIVFTVLFTKKVKREARSNNLKTNGIHIGLISFFKNIYGAVSDVVFAGSLIGFVISVLVGGGTHYISYILLALLIFAFVCHCFFNGRSYYLATNMQRLLRHNQKSEEI